MKEHMTMPLIKALQAYHTKKKINMHMPGHKEGKGFPSWLKDNLAGFDVTEIHGLDHYHHPEGVILESREACVKAFGSKNSFFLVNGSTSGIHAMLLSSFNRGDQLLIDRNCHISVIHGLILFGLQPVFVMPQYHPSWHLAIPADISDWEKAVKENPNIKGALITSPDYYGLCAPVEEIACLMHSVGKLLLVDEAHGAHFTFSKKLPQTAIEQGADLCVQSLHKTMPALTQAAILHIGSRLVDENRVSRAISMLTTTSPSYAIMASIDYARCFSESEGVRKYGKLIETLSEMKQELLHMQHLRLVPDKIENITRDPTRIVVDTSCSDITGYALCQRLETDYCIISEMADANHVVFIVTLTDSDRELNHIKNSLMELDRQIGRQVLQPLPLSPKPLDTCYGPLSGLNEFMGSYEEIPLTEAEGHRSAGMITPYPPGIPVLCPGETIKKEQIETLRQTLLSGYPVQGLKISKEDKSARIQVICDG